MEGLLGAICSPRAVSGGGSSTFTIRSADILAFGRLELSFGDGGRPTIVPRQIPIVGDPELIRIVPEHGAEPPDGPQPRPAGTRKAVSIRRANAP
jgi:hypothetical protein